MPNHHRKRKKTFRITTGMKTGIYILVGLLIFFILLFQVWDCQF